VIGLSVRHKSVTGTPEPSAVGALIPVRLIKPLLTCLLFWLGAPNLAHAQTVGDVAGPDVNPNTGQVSWRTGFRPESDRRREALAQRLHVQWAPNGQLHLRAGAVWTRSGNQGLGFNNLFGEVLWQTHENEVAGFDSALRFDLQVADTDRDRNRVRATWLAQRALADTWEARMNLSVAQQFGDRANEDIIFGAGALVSRALVGRQRLGLEATHDTLSEVTQVGPMLFGPITGPWSYTATVLAGASNAAAPTEFRVFLNRSF
jgi:hypothetical protein